MNADGQKFLMRHHRAEARLLLTQARGLDRAGADDETEREDNQRRAAAARQRAAWHTEEADRFDNLINLGGLA